MARQKLLYWLFAALAALALLCGLPNDRYSRTWTAEALPSGGEVLIETSRHADERQDAGPFTAGPATPLAAGRYRAIWRYAATAPGSTTEVTAPGLLNADNTLGAALAAAEFDPAATELALPFTLPADVADLEVTTAFSGEGTLTLHSLSIVSVGLAQTDHIVWAALALLAFALGYFVLFGRPRRAARASGEALADGQAASALSGGQGAAHASPAAQAQAAQAPWGPSRRVGSGCLPLHGKPTLGYRPPHRLRRLWPVLAVLAVALLASYPAFASFSPFGWDLEFHLTRIQGIADAWRGGQFPARLYPTPVNGMGYLLGAMYPDLFLWPAAALRLLGVSLQGCYNFTLLALNLATAGIAYYSARRLFGSEKAGVVTALLYTFAQYRIVDVYARAALGEALAMAFLPLLVLALYEIFFGDARRWPLAAVAATGILQSHLLSVFIVGLFALAFALVFIRRLWREKARLAALGKALALCLGLNLWFLLPFAWYGRQGLGVFGTFHYTMAEEALQPAQLFMLFSQGGALGEDMPLGPGLALWLCLGLAATALLLGWGRGAGRGKARGMLALGLGFSLPALWMCTRLFPWQLVARLPVIGTAFTALQFPWRFLMIPSVLLAFCGGALCVIADRGTVLLSATAGAAKASKGRGQENRPPVRLLVTLLALCVLTQAGTMDRALDNPRTLTPETRDRALDVNQLYGGQYLYAGSDLKALVNRDGRITAPEGEPLEITNYSKNGLRLHFSYESPGFTPVSHESPSGDDERPYVVQLELPLVWYPGYRAETAEGEAIQLTPSANGLVEMFLSPGEGTITVWYAGLWWQRIGGAISLAVLAAWAVWAVRRRRKHT